MATRQSLRGDSLHSMMDQVTPKESLVPADYGYDYQDFPPPAAYESTRERVKHRLMYPPGPPTSAETRQALEVPDTRISKRDRRGQRAKIPDGPDSPDFAMRETQFQHSTSADANTKPWYIKNSTSTHLLLDYTTPPQARDLRTLILRRIIPKAGISVESPDIIGL